MVKALEQATDFRLLTMGKCAIFTCMSRSEKLMERFLSKPKDFTFKELETLLTGLGYKRDNAGKSSGSRVAFVNSTTKHIIRLHRPHPKPVLKRYLIELIVDELKRKGFMT